jgi:hypothetical protein
MKILTQILRTNDLFDDAVNSSGYVAWSRRIIVNIELGRCELK